MVCSGAQIGWFWLLREFFGVICVFYWGAGFSVGSPILSFLLQNLKVPVPEEISLELGRVGMKGRGWVNSLINDFIEVIYEGGGCSQRNNWWILCLPDRRRPELLPEELHRQFIQTMQDKVCPEVQRNLEDFRYQKLSVEFPFHSYLSSVSVPAQANLREIKFLLDWIGIYQEYTLWPILKSNHQILELGSFIPGSCVRKCQSIFS